MARLKVILVAWISAFCLMPTVLEAAITIQFDYTYDTSDFFAEGSQARQSLEWAGKYYSCLLDDDLTEIDYQTGTWGMGFFTWERSYTAKFWQPNTSDDASTTNVNEGLTTVSDFTVPADMLTIYVGSQSMSGDSASTLAWSAPGWYESVTDNKPFGGSDGWMDQVISRGEGAGLTEDVYGSSAYEVGIWGGSVSVNTNFNWNEDHAALPESGEYDLTSVMLHEFCHTLGFGISDSWNNLLVNETTFTGTESTAANGGVSPSTPSTDDTGHWSTSTSNSTVFGTDDSQRTVMEPYFSSALNLWTTTLDIAGLDDIGWDINPIDLWQGASGGVFSNASNWSTGASPGWRDSVQFDSASSQAVAFTQDAQIMQASFGSGQTTWSLGGYTAETDLLWVTGSGTSFNVEGGTLRVAVMATVDAGASVTVQNAGRLELLDSTFCGSLTIDSGGELAGNGVVSVDLYHNAGGVVSPGGSGTVGSFEIEGDYDQAEDAILQIDLLGETEFDTITVGDDASLAGDLLISLGESFAFTEDDVFTILICANLSGEFGSLLGDVADGNLFFDVIYEDGTTTDMVSLVVTAAAPGDANRDGKVDGSDVTILANNWQEGVDGTGEASWELGDFNDDGVVDGSDVTILANNWQDGVSMNGAAVPEPSMVMLLICLAVFWIGRKSVR